MAVSGDDGVLRRLTGLSGGTPKAVEEMEDALCPDESICEVTRWGPRNFTRNVSCLL